MSIVYSKQLEFVHHLQEINQEVLLQKHRIQKHYFV